MLEWLGTYAKALGVDRQWFGAYVSALAMSVVSFAGVSLLVLLKVLGWSPYRLNMVVEYGSLSFAGTVLVADALLHLLPHALEGADHDTMINVGLAATLGCMAVLVIPELLESGHDHNSALGWANLLTEMLHNFADGMSLGVAWVSGTTAGLATTLAVAVHEIPQELGDFMVLRAAGFSVGRLLFWNFLVSLTCVAGVGTVHVVGAAAANGVERRYLSAFTAGSFLALALNMIFPQVSASIKSHPSGMGRVLAKLLCAVLGCLAVWSLLRIGDLEHDDHSGHDHGHDHGHAHGAEL